MSFENIISRISQTVAAIVVFLLADGFYLAQKGFTLIDGDIVLVSEAQARDTSPTVKEVAESLGVTQAAFTVPDGYVLGDKKAPVTIFELSSLGCSHCAEFHLDVLPKLKKDYIETGKVKLIFADFPIDQKSMKAQMLARCMPEDKYFDFLSLLFKKQMSWGMSFKSEKLLIGYAEMEGMDPKKAAECMKDDKVAEELIYIRQQAMEKLKIQGTPSFVIRNSEKEEVIQGVPSYDKLKGILDSYL